MKILTVEQIRTLDQATINEEPISSLELMERASKVFVKWFQERVAPDTPILICCGIGNNGGDGLAVARLLYQQFYHVHIIECRFSENSSSDFKENFERLPSRSDISVITLNAGDSFPAINKGAVIIDAIFGSGLNRPVEGYWGDWLKYLNHSESDIYSIDIPSGLFADKPSNGIAIHAKQTLSFEAPKLAFMFRENAPSVGVWEVRSIGLHGPTLKATNSDKQIITKEYIQRLVKTRAVFDHKGDYGHALLICGSKGKMGACILAARACLRAGVGLLTVHIPGSGYNILQTAVPEAMVSGDDEKDCFSNYTSNLNHTSLGIGCGLGTDEVTVKGMIKLLAQIDRPTVIDADGLNILAQKPELLEKLRKNTIITPHPKEFERIAGQSKTDFDRHTKQIELSQKHGIYIVLKGAHSCTSTPTGEAYFNSTGNPGMATAGSGDVLTGIITGLLSRGYNPKEAAILGTYIHGLAGDFAKKERGYESMIAGDIINHLGSAFKNFEL